MGEDLQDYRIYCFNGCPKLVYSYTNKSVYEGTKPEPVYCDIFDCEWNALPFHQKSLPKGGLNPPKQLAEMIELAKVLSRNIAFVRVDLYQYNNKPVIGEMTLFPGGGLSEFYPKEWDSIIGGWLEIPTKR